MKTIVTMALVGAGALAFAEAPDVSDVTLTPQADGTVAISYTLSAAPAVVTLDVETNVTGDVWASVGGENLWQLTGDVMKRVTVTTGSIVWRPPTEFGRKLGTTPVRARVTAWPEDDTPDYLVVAVTAGATDRIRYYPSAAFLPGGLTACDTYRMTRMAFRKIRAKGVTWQMGDGATRTLTMTNNYYIGVFPVTTAQAVHLGWTAVYGTLGNANVSTALRPCSIAYNRFREGNSTAGDANHRYPKPPASNSVVGVLNERTGLDFDLPCEAEWEYAARAGYANGWWNDGGKYGTDPMPGFCTETGGGTAIDGNALPGTPGGTAVVGSFRASDWGLYDTAGNGFEWCLDWFTADANILAKAGVGANANGDLMADGATTGTRRVLKKNNAWASQGWHLPVQRLSDVPAPTGNGNVYGARLRCRAGLK